MDKSGEGGFWDSLYVTFGWIVPLVQFFATFCQSILLATKVSIFFMCLSERSDLSGLGLVKIRDFFQIESSIPNKVFIQHLIVF